MKVLIVEDDPQIIETVALILELRWPEASLISTFFGEKGGDHRSRTDGPFRRVAFDASGPQMRRL